MPIFANENFSMYGNSGSSFSDLMSSGPVNNNNMEKFSSYVITLEESPDSQSNYRNWSNCVRTHTHTNGDQYTGEWQDGKYHGQGTFTAAYGSYV